MNPTYRPLAIGAALILAGFTLPGVASASDESNFAESRGYETCLDGARRASANRLFDWLTDGPGRDLRASPLSSGYSPQTSQI